MQPLCRKKTGHRGCFWFGRLISSDGVLMIKRDFKGETRTLLCPSDLMASSSCQKSQPVIDPPASHVRIIETARADVCSVKRGRNTERRNKCAYRDGICTPQRVHLMENQTDFNVTKLIVQFSVDCLPRGWGVGGMGLSK